jgi:hypothetical protein
LIVVGKAKSGEFLRRNRTRSLLRPAKSALPSNRMLTVPRQGSIPSQAPAAIGPIERLLNMLGEQRICAMVYACAFAINLGLCIVLIPHFGMVGAAISTASALIIETIMLYIVTKNRLGFHVFVWAR